MSDYMLESEPEIETPYRDVGRFLSGSGRWEWAVEQCDRLLAVIKREGETSDEELIQHVGMPDYSPSLKHLFTASDLPTIFLKELAPILSTNPAVEWMNAWDLEPDAPEPGSEAWIETASKLQIPREERPGQFRALNTKQFAAFIERVYADLYDIVTTYGTKASTHELYRKHSNFGFDQSELAEVMDYFAQLDVVIPPEGRDEYTLSPLYVHGDTYELAVSGTATIGEKGVREDEMEYLKELIDDAPPAWRYVEADDVEATEAAEEGETAA